VALLCDPHRRGPDRLQRVRGGRDHAGAGGARPETQRVYWSHLATYRANNWRLFGVKPLRTLGDLADAAREAPAQGEIDNQESDPEQTPYRDELFTVLPEIKDGHMKIPTGPGWGTELNEAAARKYAWTG
jgi:hypothetical protein